MAGFTHGILLVFKNSSRASRLPRVDACETVLEQWILCNSLVATLTLTWTKTPRGFSLIALRAEARSLSQASFKISTWRKTLMYYIFFKLMKITSSGLLATLMERPAIALSSSLAAIFTWRRKEMKSVSWAFSLWPTPWAAISSLCSV